jgi:glycosyltransferase involved in cell wall biosynthesis
MHNHFKIIVPFYNVEEWIKICTRSIKAQNYNNFQCILIDDVSTDKSAEIAEREISGDDRFVLVRNEEKAYALKNIYDAINLSKPKEQDIIVTVDGDDWLANKNVLTLLNEEYKKNDCWLTYGSYAEYPSGSRGKFAKQIPTNVINNSLYRQSTWCSSHLRTFKYHLWNSIEKQDLLDQEGKFYRMAWDLAFMFPMLEMAGHKSRYIKNILYIYNVANPLNDHKVDHEYQLRVENQIRNKMKYNLCEKKNDHL